uniref:hypothetical protein n=1 Tax=Ensifer aridi TaxID=1708715 RepID=UPI001AECDEFD
PITHAFGVQWQKAVADLERLSGGRLPKQNPAVAARTIRVGKSNLSKSVTVAGDPGHTQIGLGYIREI